MKGVVPMTVSIIVPIYNVEKHIESCVRSLMQQTYRDIEYIFVDDASPDGSIDVLHRVLSDFPRRREQFKLVVHEKNKGLPAARNTGLARASGTYIYHCDSDDWVEATMVSDLVDALERKKADIAYCDFYLSFHKNERYMRQPGFDSAQNAMAAMLGGSMKYNVWNKLVKRSLYVEHDISFPEGKGMGEDMTMIKLFAQAERIAYLPKAYYHYMQTNPNAFTKSFKESHLDEVLENAQDIIRYLEVRFGKEKFLKEIHYFKLNVKLPLLFSGESEMFSAWRALFPDSDAFIKSNPQFSKRTKFIQWAAIRKQDWIVRLYNFVLFRVIYGVIYK